MELFKILGEIAIDSTKAEKSISSVSNESKKIGDGFKEGSSQAGKSLAEIAAENGKTVNEIRSEASKIAAEYRKQGMDASAAMKKAYSDIGYESGKASKKMADDAKDAESKQKKSFDGIANSAKTLGKGIVGVGAAIGGAFVAAVEGTREYRAQMGLLESAFVQAGHSSEAAKSTYSDLNAVMGDTEAAVEASQHLANICDNEDELADLTNSLTGVYAEFGASLPLEGLAEGILHSSELGEVQGSLADALEWSGITVDEFNAQLEQCSSVEERQDLITNTLRETYSKSAEQYKETNKDVMEARVAQERLTDAMAQLGAVGEPIMTAMKNALSGVIEKAIPFVEMLVSKIPSATEATKSKFSQVLPYLQQAWQTLWNVAQTIWNTVGKPVFEFVVQAAQKVVSFFQANFPKIKAVVQDVFSIIKSLWENVLKPVLTILGNYIRDVLLPVWTKAFDGIMKAVKIAFDGIIKLWNGSLKPILNGIITFVNGVLTGNWKKAWEGIKSVVSGVFSGIKTVVSTGINLVKSIFSTGLSVVGETTKRIFGFVKDTISEKIESAKEAVDKAIKKIKDFFNIELKFKAIKMPKISIDWEKSDGVLGKAAELLDLPGVPKFSVTWNALGGILTKPTIFGAQLLGGGEAGDEAIAPIDLLQEYVREAVREQNEELNRTLRKMYDLLATLLPQIAENADKDIVLNDGVLVGRLAPSIDRELGSITIKKNRGNM